ncbi:MAG: hypothetical protein GXO87_04270 [Chlorobi bacterium]|nr:hypothetical protein [Chlorobiota bacterium]
MKKVPMFLGKGFDYLEAAPFIEALGWRGQRDNLIPIKLFARAFHDEVTG